LHDAVFQDYSAAHAVLCALRGLSAQVGMTAWLWGWLDNQVLAAVKLVPLGQQDGQKLMHALKPSVTLAIEQAMQLDLESAGSAPIGLAVTSARHETQYARLFRS
jgi:urease accessory protein